MLRGSEGLRGYEGVPDLPGKEWGWYHSPEGGGC